MDADPASLDRLHDIIAPGPVPWWPPAPGVYVVLGVVVMIFLCLIGRAVRHHLRQAYRREALAALGTGRLSALELATLLRRTALTAFPREQVAALTGPAWIAWLGRTGGLAVPPAVADLLTSGIYGGAGPADTADLAAFVRLWVRRHRLRPPSAGPEPGTLTQ